MGKQAEKLEQKNFDAIRNRLFDRVHKTGEEVKNDFPNALRRAIEVEAWKHFADGEGKPFTNLVDWLAYTFPMGVSLGQGSNAITYEEALTLTEGHADVHATLAKNAPKGRPGRKKAGLNGAAPHRFDRHGTHKKALLVVRLAEEHPDIFAAYERGEYRSITAAAEAAGLVKPGHDPLKRLKSYWKKASKKEQQAFLAWVKTDEAKGIARAKKR